MSRGRAVQVTVQRNDSRMSGFKRWTVYIGNEPVADIEASSIESFNVVNLLVARTGERNRDPVLLHVQRPLRPSKGVV